MIFNSLDLSDTPRGVHKRYYSRESSLSAGGLPESPLTKPAILQEKAAGGEVAEYFRQRFHQVN